MTPAPRLGHQAIVAGLLFQLEHYLSPIGLQRTLFPGPADIFWGDDIWVQPDLLVVAPERAIPLAEVWEALPQ